MAYVCELARLGKVKYKPEHLVIIATLWKDF